MSSLSVSLREAALLREYVPQRATLRQSCPLWHVLRQSTPLPTVTHVTHVMWEDTARRALCPSVPYRSPPLWPVTWARAARRWPQREEITLG